MTWEWALVISTFLVCTTTFVSLRAAVSESNAMKDLRAAVEKVVGVQNTITSDMVNIKATQERVEKMAEDTKNLLSKGNLAAGFTPRASR